MADCVRSAWGRGTDRKNLQASFPTAHNDWPDGSWETPLASGLELTQRKSTCPPGRAACVRSTQRQVLPLLGCLEQANRWDKQQTNKKSRRKSQGKRSPWKLHACNATWMCEMNTCKAAWICETNMCNATWMCETNTCNATWTAVSSYLQWPLKAGTNRN